MGRPASFNCSVTGHPVTSVEWYHNQKPLSRGSSHSPYSVTIPSVRREDRGVYQCYAYNEEESAQAAAELSLAGTQKPSDVTAPDDMPSRRRWL